MWQQVENAAQAADAGGGDGLEEDAVGGGLDDGAGAVLDLEEFAQTQGDHHLAFGGEFDRIGEVSRIHAENMTE